jgi:hypothetical protein
LTYDDAWQRIGVDYDYGVSVTPTQAVASVNSQDPPAAIAMPDPCVMSSAAWSAMPADPSNWSLPGAQDVFRYWAIQQTGKALFVLLIGCTGGLAGVWIACRDASVSPPSRQ